jgi:hypothetical protein
MVFLRSSEQATLPSNINTKQTSSVPSSAVGALSVSLSSTEQAAEQVPTSASVTLSAAKQATDQVPDRSNDPTEVDSDVGENVQIEVESLQDSSQINVKTSRDGLAEGSECVHLLERSWKCDSSRS